MLGSGHVAGKLVAVLSAALLARGLGPDGLGSFATAVTLLGFVLVATNWGTDFIGIRDVSTQPQHWASVNRSVRSLRLKLAIAGVLLTAGIAWAFHWDLGFVAPLALAAIVFSFRGDWLLLAMGRPQWIAIATVVREVVFCVLVALAVAGRGSIRHAAWAYLIADLAWAICTQLFIRKLPPATPRGDRTGHLLREGWPMVVTSSMSLTYNKADTPMLAAMLGAAIAGTYWAAYSILFAVLGFASVLSRSALPELSRTDKRDLSKLPSLVLTSALCGGLISMLLIGSSPEIMDLLYGRAFLSGAAALAILALVLPMNFSSGVLLNRLVAVGRQRLLAVASVSGAAINVALNLVLIPRMGMRGAAIATLASEAVLLSIGLAGLSGLPRARPFVLKVVWMVGSALLIGFLVPRELPISGPVLSLLLAAVFLFVTSPVIGTLLRSLGEIAAERRFAAGTSGGKAQGTLDRARSARPAGPLRLVYVTRTLAPYRLPLFRKLRERSVETHIVVAGAPVPGVPDVSSIIAEEIAPIERRSRGFRWREDVIEACERLHPDLLLIEHGARLDFAWTLLATRRLPHAKRVLWTHGIERKELYSGLPNTGTPGRWVQLHMADALLCYDRGMAETLRDRLPGKPVVAAPNSTDGVPILAARRALLHHGRSELKRSRGLDRSFYLAGLGRMMPDKLQHRLPRILTLARARIPDVGLLFIGDGPQRRRILRSASAHHLIEGRDFRILGDIRDVEELTAWLLCSDLVVSPGYMGLAATDALFAGVPVVLARAGGNGPYHSPEWKYLRDSVGGIFAQDRSDDAFAEAVVSYLAEPEAKRRSVEDACVRYAETHLGMDPMVRGILGLLPSMDGAPAYAVAERSVA